MAGKAAEHDWYKPKGKKGKSEPAKEKHMADEPMHERHKREMGEMHARHEKEHGDMHKRHRGEHEVLMDRMAGAGKAEAA